MYYGLSNYYQNHRRYVKSRDDNQLLGRLSDIPSSDCQPFAYDLNSTSQKEQPIAPCGAIANSLFNGKFAIFVGLLLHFYLKKHDLTVLLCRKDVLRNLNDFGFIDFVIIYCLFINLFAKYIKHAQFLLFADGFKMFLHFDTLDHARDFNSLNEWCTMSCLYLNIIKCCAVIYD